MCGGTGQYSISARATIIVTGALSVVTSALFLLYNSVMLTLIKRKHDKETKALERGEGAEQGVRESGVVRTV